MRRKVIFFLLFGLEKKYKEKKNFLPNFFPLFGLEKMNKAKKNISYKIKM